MNVYTEDDYILPTQRSRIVMRPRSHYGDLSKDRWEDWILPAIYIPWILTMFVLGVYILIVKIIVPRL